MLRFRVALLLLVSVVASASYGDDASRLSLRPSAGPRADVAALILGGHESGTLRTTGMAIVPCVAKAAPETNENTVPVDLLIEVEGRSLLDAVSATTSTEIPKSVRLEIYTYVMTRSGEIAASSSKWARAALGQLTGRSFGGIKLVDQLELEPGEYQARVLIREPVSQQFALRVLELSVPPREDPALSVPLFQDDDGSWLIAADTRNGEEQLASALPVVSPGRPRPFRINGCRISGARLEGRLLTIDGEAVSEAQIHLGPLHTMDGAQEFDGELEMPDLEAGLYVLEVSAVTSDTELTRKLPVFLSENASVTTWAGVGSLAPETAIDSETVDLEEESGSRKRIEAIERSYLEVLELLASGRLEESVGALARLEKSAIGAHENRRKSLKWLTEGENRVTRRILDFEVEALLPLLMLHLETQSRYVDASDVESDLLEASRSRVRALADVYASEAKQEMAPALAAAALTELATDLQSSGYLISALLVLREALALDRSNTDVLLELSYQYEHHGFREESLEILRHLLDVEPQSDEGRLRLAVALMRSGQEHQARELLRELIADGSLDWAVVVACQELGRAFLTAEKYDEARTLLAAAVERFPANQRLRIQLAYALDRTGKRSQSRAMATTLPRDSGVSSPRLLYRVPERRNTLRSRKELLRHATARIPLLVSALAAAREIG